MKKAQKIDVLRHLSSFMPRAALLKILTQSFSRTLIIVVQFGAHLRKSQILIVFLNYRRGLPELYYILKSFILQVLICFNI